MPVYNAYGITQLAAAFTEALGVPRPERADEPAAPLARLIREGLDGRPAGRAVIFNPDAIALWLFQKYTPDFAEVLAHTQLALPLRTVMPSVTPVCFGSMYTGAPPQVHGIQKYEKPVIRTDTVFDALIRAGKRCAIVSVEGASMSRIFLERDMDYFVNYASDEEATQKGLELIASDRYDFISIYNSFYDHTMHATQVEAPEALDHLRRNCRNFGLIAEAAARYYAAYDTLIGFAPDHGAHDNELGRGSHGTDLPEDLNIMHFYGVRRGRQG